jgi:hypothetical protein
MKIKPDHIAAVVVALAMTCFYLAIYFADMSTSWQFCLAGVTTIIGGMGTVACVHDAMK